MPLSCLRSVIYTSRITDSRVRSTACQHKNIETKHAGSPASLRLRICRRCYFGNCQDAWSHPRWLRGLPWCYEPEQTAALQPCGQQLLRPGALSKQSVNAHQHLQLIKLLI